MLLPLIPTKVHGVIDYIASVLLIILPWTIGLSQYTMAPWIMVIIGIGGIIYSLFTRYELGYVGLMSMRMHLWFDILSGFILIVSPWVFDFTFETYRPHVICGSIIIGLALLTQTKSEFMHGPKLSPTSNRRESTQNL
jgi:hypothetical protein